MPTTSTPRVSESRGGPSRRRLLRCALLGVLAALALTGCSAEEALRMGWPEPVTREAEGMRNFWVGSWLAALVVGIFVWGLIFWVMFRYRRRTDELPRQVRYNLPIEVLYTVVPFIIVGVLFYYTAVIETDVTELTDDPDVTIGVVGFQWNWQFNYPDEGLQVTGRPGAPAVLILPTDRRIRFVETSPDVIHSFWVPAFLFKRDVIPGRINEFEVEITKEGTYVGRCAELCGTDHDRMNFEVRAVSPEEYERFIDSDGREIPGEPLYDELTRS